MSSISVTDLPGNVCTFTSLTVNYGTPLPITDHAFADTTGSFTASGTFDGVQSAQGTVRNTTGFPTNCDSGQVAWNATTTADPPPGAPTLTDTDPDSPANDNNPEVKGTVGSGNPTDVEIYGNATCSGSPDATGAAAELTGAGITVNVPDDATTALSAIATNASGDSPCSNSIDYTEDSTPPAKPTFASTDPASPANDNNPKLKGAANSTVDIHTTGDCSGAPVASGDSADFTGSGIPVAVADDSTTTFHATATDTAGNTSPCSDDSITYVEDSTAPQTQIDSGPSGTTSDPSPSFAFSANEGGSSFECRIDGGGFGGCESPHTTAALDDGEHTFEVRATDQAGNTDPSPASRTFTVDTTPSEPPPPDGGTPPGGTPPGTTPTDTGDDAACQAATDDVTKAKKKVKKAKRNAKKARGGSGSNAEKAKKRLKKAKQTLKKAKGEQAEACS